MADPRRSDSTKLGASLVGRVAGGPAPGLVAEGEVWVLRLAVPRHLNDLAAGTFLVDVLLCGPPARDVVGRLVEGCPLRVSGPLDVGPCQTVDRGRRWGLQLVARELAIEEIDLADACPSAQTLLEHPPASPLSSVGSSQRRHSAPWTPRRGVMVRPPALLVAPPAGRSLSPDEAAHARCQRGRAHSAPAQMNG